MGKRKNKGFEEPEKEVKKVKMSENEKLFYNSGASIPLSYFINGTDQFFSLVLVFFMSASASFHIVLLVRASSRGRSTKIQRFIAPTSGIPFLALRQRLGKRIRLWLICLVISHKGRKRRLPRSRSPGCWRRSRGSFRSRVLRN